MITSIVKTLLDYKNCNICPQDCGVNRLSGERGFCNTGLELSVSSVAAHTGEEPPISGKAGICNVFFGHCNLQCLYCQNHQISRNHNLEEVHEMKFDVVIEQIIQMLSKGISHLGFVSPTHVPLQMKMIINHLKAEKYSPVIVYNSNAYEKVETLKIIGSDIDVYLPDFKYADDELSVTYSGANHYVKNALSAITEMIRQKGTLQLDKFGMAKQGVIIRHLVLPGHIKNSLDVLRLIAKEFGNDVHLSLMAQYYPMQSIKEYANMNRVLNPIEYEIVLEELEKLGFQNGWVQELESNANYLPDFSSENPFGSN